MNIKLKLSSNFQTVEFDLNVEEKDDPVLFEKKLDFTNCQKRINQMINLINYIGENVNAESGKIAKKSNSDKQDKKGKNQPQQLRGQQKLATDKQIYALQAYGIDATGMTSKQAWDTLNRIKEEEESYEGY